MKQPFSQRTRDKHSLSFTHLWEQIRSQKRDFRRSNLYGILATLLLLPVPLMIPLLIDEVLLGHPGRLSAFFSQWLGSDRPWLMIIGVTLAVISLRLAAFWTTNAKTLHATRIAQRIAYALRHRVLHHLERLAIGEYETLHTGGIASKTVQDVEQIAAFASQLVTSALSATLMLAGIAGVMLWMDWRLALLVFTLNPLFLGFSRILGRKSARLLRRRHEAYQIYHELLTETLELFLQVRASNQERHFFGLIRQRAKAIEEASLDYGYQAAVTQGASSLLTASVVDLFRAAGIAAVAYSDLSIGLMIAFLFYLSTLTQPIQQLMVLLIGYRSSRPAMERIDRLLQLPQEPCYPQEADPFAKRTGVPVAVERLHFAYRQGAEILHGITLYAEAGEKIALVGPSGSGKSTVAQLLVGFYPPDRGTIRYGGVAIGRIGLERVRSHVALMLQDSLFFNDTIRMNLSLSRDIPEAHIYEALKMAQMDAFVRSLNQGLDTPIGKNGIRLSGGQRQRLAIARLILSDPHVVIFDEATSALDGETEAALYRSLAPFLADRTVIIIAHRETTIRQAQRIYLIESGKVKAEGSYTQLSEQGLLKTDFDDLS